MSTLNTQHSTLNTQHSTHRSIAPFKGLLEKELTRSEFLLHLSILFLAITGISGLLKTLSDPHLLSKHKKTSSGFGAGPYGV